MITVVGIGPGGSGDFIFDRAKAAIAAGDLIIGSQRQLQVVPTDKQRQTLTLPRKLADLEDVLRKNRETEIVLLASGDPLTYGIGKWLLARFPKEEVTILPGISSIHYLFNRLEIPMEDCFFTSSHGKEPQLELIFRLPKVGMVTDKKNGPYQLAQAALAYPGKSTFYIGENLSYPNERIRCFEAADVPDEEYEMNVVVIINEG